MPRFSSSDASGTQALVISWERNRTVAGRPFSLSSSGLHVSALFIVSCPPDVTMVLPSPSITKAVKTTGKCFAVISRIDKFSDVEEKMCKDVKIQLLMNLSNGMSEFSSFKGDTFRESSPAKKREETSVRYF